MTSPAANTPATDVRRCESTSTPCGVVRTPIVSSSRRSDVRRPSAGNEDLIHAQRALARGVTNMQHDGAVAVLHTRRLHPEVQADSLRLEDPAQHACDLRILAGQEGGIHIDHLHHGAEPAERLRELETDGAGPHDEQPSRLHAQLEHALVREIWHALETLDRWDGRTAAGAHDNALRAEALVADLQRARVDKPRPPMAHDDSRRLEMGGVLVSRDPIDDVVDAVHHRREVHAHLAGADAEPARVRNRVMDGGRLDERLRRHAPVPRAFAAERTVADEQDAPPPVRSRLRGREPRRAATDDGKIEGVAHAEAGTPANTRHELCPPNPNDVVIASRTFAARPTLGM